MSLFIYLFIGCVTQFARSLFPDQASRPGRESTESKPLDCRKILVILNASHFVLMKIKEKHDN